MACFPASNGGVIAAATLGSIVGLVAMVLFLIFILRRRRDTEEEIANEIKSVPAEYLCCKNGAVKRLSLPRIATRWRYTRLFLTLVGCP